MVKFTMNDKVYVYCSSLPDEIYHEDGLSKIDIVFFFQVYLKLSDGRTQVDTYYQYDY